MAIIPLIMSGGSGTRLWPLSRKTRPKQFLSLDDDHSLFQNTILRCGAPCFDQKPIVVASEEHRFLVAEDLRDLGMGADILLEPVPKNSCPAVVTGCLQALSRDKDAVVLVLAADHSIDDRDAFASSAQIALSAANSGRLITFGIAPTYPATGYGYIKASSPIDGGEVCLVERFVEKPDVDTATDYVNQGFFWNSGNFMFKASAFIAEAEKYEPEMVALVRRAFEAKEADLDFLRLGKEAFEKIKPISVDYAVMEKSEAVATMPVSYGWSDIGTWSSIWRNVARDRDDNAVFGDAKIVNGTGNLVHSEDRLTSLIGVKDTIVVVTRDAVLVADQSSAEKIGELVKQLESDGRQESAEALKVYRPWGDYEALDTGEKYQVKRIVIAPGGVLSLQKHQYRAEHWIVVEGKPEVTIDDRVITLQPNQSVYIPLGAVHRISNPTTEPVVLIEVQTGTYFGEDDIIRLQDDYNRD